VESGDFIHPEILRKLEESSKKSPQELEALRKERKLERSKRKLRSVSKNHAKNAIISVANPDPYIKAVFRIRIHVIRMRMRIRIRNQHFGLNTDPDPIRIQSGSRVLMNKN
jgi:hypothetical protein